MELQHPLANKEMTLLDLLDGIIDTGVVVRGETLISIANIDFYSACGLYSISTFLRPSNTFFILLDKSIISSWVNSPAASHLCYFAQKTLIYQYH